MWIVQLALARPRIVVVMAAIIFILGGLTIVRTPTDVFPAIDLPVVNVIWSYGGLAPDEMTSRIMNISERASLTTVDNIDHIESEALPGVCMLRVYLRPGSNMSQAIAQLTSINSTITRVMPQGTTPPAILQSDASNVPIIQLALESDVLTAAQLNDIASNELRPVITVLPGLQVSPPFGGVPRVVQVDLDEKKLFALGLAPTDVASALASQNLILPAGTAKIGNREYFVRINNSYTDADSLNNVPIKIVNGAMVYIRDVAHVRDGFGIQVNEVNANERPAVLLTIFKSSTASTLTVAEEVRQEMPYLQSLLPPGVKLTILQDQSQFVRESVQDVVQEGVTAAVLTALMVLLFLGSWRSTLIVFISIPLAVLTSIAVLGAMHQTLNTLTLGGLALAVGILVDDATVEIENTTRIMSLDDGRTLKQCILESAREVALPTLASTLSICIVFVPIAFLSGIAKSLFLPLALAVIFAMLPSYMLSRSLVTTFMHHLVGAEMPLHRPNNPKYREQAQKMMRGPLWRAHEVVEHALERLRGVHYQVLSWALWNRKVVGLMFLLFFAGSLCLVPFIGEDFFPTVDSGAIRLHVRAPAGTRLEDTVKVFADVEASIRRTIPPSEIELILDNIGTPGTLNLAFSNTDTIGPADGEIDVTLTERHHPTFDYIRELRTRLKKEFPNESFYFAPADIQSQILDFGTSAPIDVLLEGPYRNNGADYALAKKIAHDCSIIPGAVDVYIRQVPDAPEIRVNVDRDKAEQVGLTQANVASSILVSLSSSAQAAPSYYVDPTNGVQYSVQAQTPQREIDSLNAVMSTPVTNSNIATGAASSGAVQPQLLYNLATTGRDVTPAIVTHYSLLPSYDVFVSTDRRDLGGVVAGVNRVVDSYRKDIPRGSKVAIVGQAKTMTTSFLGMAVGIVFAIILVYLLLVVNFESFTDPAVILSATPSALCGILWILFATRTTFNVPSLMGTIMCIGVATANSILLVTFANDQRLEGKSAREAALEAGQTRLRPVMMTAMAMIIGMLPMSLALGAGGEQNAPLGRAVIGGLLLATISTLLWVPVVYSVLRAKEVKLEADEEEISDPTGRLHHGGGMRDALSHDYDHDGGSGGFAAGAGSTADEPQRPKG